MSNNPSSPIQPLPNNLQLITEYDAIVIRRRWRTPVAYFLVFFSLIWNGFMVGWMTMAFTQGIWIMAAFGSIHAAVGLFLIYFTIALFLNTTDIRVDAYNLSVKHYPLPWRGSHSIPVAEVVQLYCEEKVSRGKNGTTVTYNVQYVDKNNRQRILASGLPEKSQARYIERELEKTLGIKNRPVEGEMA